MLDQIAAGAAKAAHRQRRVSARLPALRLGVSTFHGQKFAKAWVRERCRQQRRHDDDARCLLARS
jgi:hypothetical protein